MSNDVEYLRHPDLDNRDHLGGDRLSRISRGLRVLPAGPRPTGLVIDSISGAS